MIGTLLTIAVMASLFVASQWWWRSLLNPVSLGILAWTPGLIMLNWPPFFLSPVYLHLNRPVAPELYYAMTMSFFAFWAGCATVKALSPAAAFRIDPARLRLDLNVPRTLVFFAAGFLVFVYVYLNSGLLELQNLDEVGVAESQLRLHIGPLSFIILFMDVAAIGMFVRFLQQRGGLINILPMIVAMACQAATLQKSRFVFLVIACVLLALLHPRETYHIFFRSYGRRALVIAAAIVVVAAPFLMNAARGVAVVQMTAASNSILEQIYIYSGATSMMNVSVTLEGYLPSDPPTLGAYIARPVLWHLVYRDLFFVSRYFEGVNGATYLIYAWADFRWLGFVITPFLVGMMAMIFLRLALAGSLLGFLLGVIGMQALVYSPNTDIMFEPTTWLLISIGIIAQLFTYPFEKSGRTKAPPGDLRYGGPGGMPRQPSRSGPLRR